MYILFVLVNYKTLLFLNFIIIVIIITFRMVQTCFINTNAKQGRKKVRGQKKKRRKKKKRKRKRKEKENEEEEEKK